MPMSRVIVLVVALSAGGGAAYLTMSGSADEAGGADFVAPAVVEPAFVAPRLEEALIAAIDLQHRQRITAEDLQWQPWPEEALNSSLITRSAEPGAREELSGRMVRVAMFAGSRCARKR
jgi:pilus assembly protein CpaB